MAKRSPLGSDNRKDFDRQVYRIDTVTGEVFIATDSPDVVDKLDDVISALGGSSELIPTINNINVLANTETSFNLPANTKKFIIKSRDKGKVLFSFTNGGTTSNEYITVPQGAVFTDVNSYISQTIYFSSNKVDVIELLTYHKP
jgi:hypothetical protein